jgi:ribosomal protein L12E/L44/L45/RPP1/RPP2
MHGSLIFADVCHAHVRQVKAFLADPSAFVVEAVPEAAGGGGGGGGGEEAKEEEKKEEEPEEEEDDDMGFSLFD